MKTINKSVFFEGYLTASILSLLFTVGALISAGGVLTQKQLPLIIPGYILSLSAGVLFLILIYRMWKVIPKEFARTTPEKAVGYIFIPVFNLYWFFQAVWGWAKDWNSFKAKTGNLSGNMSEDLALSIPILQLINIAAGFLFPKMGFPYWFSPLLGLPSLVLTPIFIFKVCGLINDLPKSDSDQLDKQEIEELQTASNTRGTWSLVLGIVAILSMFIPSYFGVLFGPICGIISIILAKKERKLRHSGLSLAGLITGIAGLALWAISLLTLAFLLIRSYS